MPRAHRLDRPGSWHHLTNRGLAKRTLFEGTPDVRFLLSLIAYAVRRGELEIHAWAILSTHFHLYVRSLVGQLSDSMRRIQTEYVRAFNRARQRDGPLVRNRFWSRRVVGLEDMRAVVRYIDANPVQAGLAGSAIEYPHGSAWWYARPRSPRWHARYWVEEGVRRATGLEEYDPAAYARVFGARGDRDTSYVVERRMATRRGGTSGTDLLELAPHHVLEWMRRKAALADGLLPGLAIAAPETVELALDELRAVTGDVPVRLTRRSRDGWILLRAGLLRDLCGATWREIAQRLRRSEPNVLSLARAHLQLLQEEESYAELAATVAIRCRVEFTTIGTPGIWTPSTAGPPSLESL